MDCIFFVARGIANLLANSSICIVSAATMTGPAPFCPVSQHDEYIFLSFLKKYLFKGQWEDSQGYTGPTNFL